MAGQGIFFKTLNILSNNRCLLNNRVTFVNLQPSMMGLKVETRNRLKNLKIPEKPKKPSTPYVKFVTEHRNLIVKENPNIKQTDVIRKCAEDWKTVSDDLKEKYAKDYKSECDVYDKNILNFNASLSPEQQEAIKAYEDEKKADRKKRKLRKLNKETNKPKRPMGPYMRYILEQSKIRNVSIKDLMLSLKGTWAILPEVEKDKYNKQFLKDKEIYEAALIEWETKMVKEGRIDLVRSKSSEEKIPSRIKQLKKDDPQ